MVEHASDQHEGVKVVIQRRKKATRKRLTASDYKEVAADHGFEWVGPTIPTNALEPTLFRCKKAGHVWQTRYNKIYEGRPCPYCNYCWKKNANDYKHIAAWHGIEWIGDQVPHSTRIPTRWRMPDGTEFEEIYRNLRARVTRITAPNEIPEAPYKEVYEPEIEHEIVTGRRVRRKRGGNEQGAL